MPQALIGSKPWLSQTTWIGHMRSVELKSLDEALKTYEASNNEANLSNVKQAFAAWKGKTGKDWANSERNRKGMITELEKRLYGDGKATKYEEGLADSRKGMLYLFANTKVKGGWVSTMTDGLVGIGNAGIGLNQVSDILGPTKTLITGVGGEMATRIGSKITNTSVKTVRKPGEALAKVKAFFSDLANNVLASIVEKFRNIRAAPLEAADGLLGIGEAAMKLTLNFLLPKIAPFVGSAVEAFEGLKTMGKEIYRRYKVYEASIGVRLNTGHPGVIFSQIENAMNVSIGKGLYQALKGTMLLVADGVTFGSSALASLIISGAEMLIKLIWRMVEMARMNKFFAAVGPLWDKAKGDADNKGEFINDGPGFGAWYEGASLAMPCLSAIALKSGLVGDKMRMLRMFVGAGEKEVISQQQFDQGVKYIDLLKEWSSNYLNETGFKFYSSDATVNGLLNRTTA